MKVPAFLLNLLLPALEELGESKLEEVLNNLAKSNPVLYKQATDAGIIFCDALLPLVQKSKTNIDDMALGLIGDAINDSVASNSGEEITETEL